MSFYTHTLSRQFLLLVLPTSLHRDRERAGRVEIHYHKHASIGMTYPPGYEHIYSLCVSLSPTNFSVGTSKLEKKSCVQWKCRTNLYFLFHCVSGLFQKPPPPSFHGVQQHQAPPIYKSINSRFFTHFTGAGIFVFLEPLLLVATENSVSYKPYKLYMLQLRSAKNYRDLRMHLSLFPPK